MSRTLEDHIAAWEPGTISGLAKRYYELKQQIADLEREASSLNTILKEHCSKTGEVIEVEGMPPLRVVERSTGWFWDSTAVRNLIEKAPHEWQRLLELGAVTLDARMIKTALEKGQLLGRPAGGLERKAPTLIFDR